MPPAPRLPALRPAAAPQDPSRPPSCPGPAGAARLAKALRAGFAAATTMLVVPALAQFPLPIDTSRTLDAGLTHSIAVITTGARAGQVWAWGGNEKGKLGNGTTLSSSLPVQSGKGVAGFTGVVAVAAGQANSYAITPDGKLWSWGDRNSNSTGSRLGRNTPEADQCSTDFPPETAECARRPAPVPLPGTPGAGSSVHKVVQVGGGWGHAVALRSDGTVWSWGGGAPQLGLDGTSAANEPAQVVGVNGSGVLSGITQIAVGYFHTVALKSDGTLVAWGSGFLGQLGTGVAQNSNVPVAVAGLTGVVAIRAKGSHTLALKADGTAWAWGNDAYGQVGNDATTGGSVDSPVQVMTSVAAVAAGYSTSFARRTDGSIRAWGLNHIQQLGLASTANANACGAGRACEPVPVTLSAYIGSIAVVPGAAHTIIVRGNQSLAIFGDNSTGQLGDTSGNFGTDFQQVRFDPAFTMTPSPTSGTGSSVGGQSRSDDLSLPSLGSSIDFGARQPGTASSAETVTVENLSALSLTVTSIAVPTHFTKSGDGCSGQSLAANGGTCSFGIAFTPLTTGDLTGTLVINSSSAESAALELVLGGSGATVPGSPAGVSATAGNASASVSFSAPGDGGSPILSYTATSSPGAIAVAGFASPIAVTGLGNGVTYTFTVTATNAVGSSLPSAPSNPVTPAGITHPLTVNVGGNGQGSVVSSPPGISCGAACVANFDLGTAVSLSASAQAGSVFGGWSGDCAGTAGCSVTLSAARSVGATFTLSGGVGVARPDFNGDRKGDILWRNASTGQVYRMFMDAFTITGGALVYTEANTAWKIVADADFNGDGITDLLWRNDTTGQVYLMPFSGSGFPAGGAVIYTEASPAWKIVHTPDLNGDGKADILWWNSSTGMAYGLLMDGVSIVGQGVVHVEPNTSWRIAAVGDFAGSGRPNQLLWRNVATNQVYLMTVSWQGGAFAQSGVLVYQEPDLNWKIVAVADFDGNGKGDILWRNAATGTLYMMLMDGPVIVSRGPFFTESNLAWKVVAVGDFNGDAKADLLWRNETTGQVYMMIMNGMTIAAQALVYQEPNTAWTILGAWEYGQPAGAFADAGTR